MFDDCQCVYLKPGEVYFADESLVIHTVLGSCISITMYCRKIKAGIMSHCMLPCSSESVKQGDDCMKYVDCSVLYMNRLFLQKKIEKRDIEVKLFGGSDMFAPANSTVTVGQRNITAALSILDKLGYNISARDTGGAFTRKLYFSIDTGTVYQRKISRIQGL
ncbi:MAG: chemotaxis protein CheD [Deferribacterales bacterium]